VSHAVRGGGGRRRVVVGGVAAGGGVLLVSGAEGDEPVRSCSGEVGGAGVAGVGEHGADAAAAAGGAADRPGSVAGLVDHRRPAAVVAGVVVQVGGQDEVVAADHQLAVVALHAAVPGGHDPRVGVGEIPFGIPG